MIDADGPAAAAIKKRTQRIPNHPPQRTIEKFALKGK